MQRSSPTAEALRAGIAACRAGRWRQGYDELARLATSAERSVRLPGLFYSYLGVAMARCEGRKREGLELCQHGLARSPRQPDGYLNLATVLVMLGRRLPAVRALEQGLALAPRHEELLRLRGELGVRRRPVVPFLARDNPLNQLGGRARHQLVGPIDLLRQRGLADETEPSDRLEIDDLEASAERPTFV